MSVTGNSSPILRAFSLVFSFSSRRGRITYVRVLGVHSKVDSCVRIIISLILSSITASHPFAVL